MPCHPVGYCLGVLRPLKTTNARLPFSPQQTWGSGGGAPGGVRSEQKLPRKGKVLHLSVSLSPSLAPPLPGVPSGGLLHSGGRPPKFGSDSLTPREADQPQPRAREPRGGQHGGGGAQKKDAAEAGARTPWRGRRGGEGAAAGKAPGEGPAHPGWGLRQRTLGFSAPPSAVRGPRARPLRQSPWIGSSAKLLHRK